MKTAEQHDATDVAQFHPLQQRHAVRAVDADLDSEDGSLQAKALAAQATAVDDDEDGSGESRSLDQDDYEDEEDDSLENGSDSGSGGFHISASLPAQLHWSALRQRSGSSAIARGSGLWRRLLSSLSATLSRRNAALSFQSLGVVFGDIGTSPLYTLTAIFTPSSSDPALTLDPTVVEDVLGVVSLIFWSLTLVVSVKYVALVMQADNRGEGGSLALLALLRRYSRRPEQSSAPHAQDELAEAALDDDDDDDRDQRQGEPTAEARSWLRSDSLRPLTLMAFFGASLLVGDGIITPAISVLSAVEGIAVADSGLQPLVLTASLLILVLLFLGQRFSTARISGLFSPFMTLWFLALLLLGLYNLVTAPPALALSVLSGLSPHFAGSFLWRHGYGSISHLAAVVLCVTGVEAMFADLGHFDRCSIRTSWLLLVYPALSLQYLGQGVCLLSNPAVSANVFYGCLPPSSLVLWVMVLLATSATIIASQALISGAFSMTAAAIQLRFVPELTVLHTAAAAAGHIYIPAVNALLMLCTVLVVLAFRSSAALANAYGVAVCGDMLLTSAFFCCVMRIVWRLPAWRIALFVLVFVTLDLGFLLGNLAKIEAGGWLPLSIALTLSCMLYQWEWGQRQQVRAQDGQPTPAEMWNRVELSRSASSSSRSGSRAGSGDEAHVDGCHQSDGWSVFFFQPEQTAALQRHWPADEWQREDGHDSGDEQQQQQMRPLELPRSAWAFLDRLGHLPTRCLFAHVAVLNGVPYVPEAQRLHLGESKDGGRLRSVRLYYGYMDDPRSATGPTIQRALPRIHTELDSGSSGVFASPSYFLSGQEMAFVRAGGITASSTDLLSAADGRRLRRVWLGCRRWLARLRRWRLLLLMRAYNLVTRGQCHGDDYDLQAERVLKLSTKLDINTTASDAGTAHRGGSLC